MNTQRQFANHHLPAKNFLGNKPQQPPLVNAASVEFERSKQKKSRAFPPKVLSNVIQLVVINQQNGTWDREMTFLLPLSHTIHKVPIAGFYIRVIWLSAFVDSSNGLKEKGIRFDRQTSPSIFTINIMA